MDLFSGLENLGLSGFECEELFGTDEQAQEKEKNVAKEALKDPAEVEAEYLYEKSYTCPVCDGEFKAKTVKSNRAKLLSSDADLRPVYQNIDILKYDVIVCPKCGHAALTRYFGPLTATQIKQLKQMIAANYKSHEYSGITYSYDEAIERHKLALANAVVKHAKASEKAFICLKTAWLIRGKAESLDPVEKGAEEIMKACAEEENSFLKNAFEGFISARAAETPPICGMDECTLDYLIATLALRFGKLEVSAKLVAEIIVNPNTPNRIKDKARELKGFIMEEIKKRKQ